jgi:hypothetical protein
LNRGKTLSFTLCVRKRFKVPATRVVQITYEETERKTGDWRKLQNEEIHNLYLSLQTIIIKYTGIT